jgi:hypothetical protein
MAAELIYHHLEAYLHSRVRRAESRVRVYCPFVRVPALRRLYQSLPAGVSMSVTMRWDRRSFSAGASEPEVFRFCEQNGIRLCKHASLHLKVFVIDGTEVIAGSANLTDRALGDAPGDNVEFMVAGLLCTAADGHMIHALDAVASAVTPADHSMALAAAAVASMDEEALPSAREPDTHCRLSQVPMVSTPRQLWDAYTAIPGPAEGSPEERQLRAFRLPQGLDELGFLVSVRSEFFAVPLLRRLTNELRTRDLYFGELKRWLSVNCADSEGLGAGDLTVHADTLLNWMEGLGPPRYTVDRPRHSERLRYETGIPHEVLLRAPGVRPLQKSKPEGGT